MTLGKQPKQAQAGVVTVEEARKREAAMAELGIRPARAYVAIDQAGVDLALDPWIRTGPRDGIALSMIGAVVDLEDCPLFVDGFDVPVRDQAGRFGKPRALIVTVHGHKLPTYYSAETIERYLAEAKKELLGT